MQISFLKNQFELKHLYYSLGCRKDKTPVSAKRISWSYNSWSYYVSKSKKPSYIFLSLMKSIFIPCVMLPGSWLERRNTRFIGIPKLLFHHRKKSKEIYFKRALLQMLLCEFRNILQKKVSAEHYYKKKKKKKFKTAKNCQVSFHFIVIQYCENQTASVIYL